MYSKKLLIQKMERERKDWFNSVIKNAKSPIVALLETNVYEYTIKNEIIHYTRCCMFSEDFLEFLNSNENILQYMWEEFMDNDAIDNINELFTVLAFKFKQHEGARKHFTYDEG